jgi:hypothetical protein
MPPKEGKQMNNCPTDEDKIDSCIKMRTRT